MIDNEIVAKNHNVISLLKMEGAELQQYLNEAYELKRKYRGDCVYFRGLIEISNICKKNCLYCGIRAENSNVLRYELTDSQVLEEAQYALDAGYGSVVLQGGERSDRAFTSRITYLIREIRKLRKSSQSIDSSTALNAHATITESEFKGCSQNMGNGAVLDANKIVDESEFKERASSAGGGLGVKEHNFGNDVVLGITLSLGEQSPEVYQEWYNAGAHRYLLRIESSNKELYQKIHPNNTAHSFENRLNAIKSLQAIGYRTGTGVMIGLPFQTYEDLANDLLFFKEIGIDMVGMGPYISHSDTPLGKLFDGGGAMHPNGNLGELANLSNTDKLLLSLKMIAILRHLMPHINIAATTALQVLAPDGRERALLAGANIIMPNVTDLSVKGNYNLYEGKPGLNDDADATKNSLEHNLARLGIEIGWDNLGDWR